MVTARQLIEFCELPVELGVMVEIGYREDTECEGRAVFDHEAVGEKEIRYSLSALWDENRPLLFGIGFNPSKARAAKGDRTVNRVIRGAQASGNYGGVFWINLGGQMETDQSTFINEGRVAGRLNDEQIRIVLERVHPEEETRDVLLAWGGEGPKLAHWINTAVRHRNVHFLTFGTTQDHRPRHPSRLKTSQGLVRETSPASLR